MVIPLALFLLVNLTVNSNMKQSLQSAYITLGVSDSFNYRGTFMPRELDVEFTARKKALNAEQIEIDEALSKLPPEHLWVVDKSPTEYLTPEEANVKGSYLALNDRKLRVQAQLDRAYRIAPSDINGSAPTFCINCFIDHETRPLMVKVESDLGHGIRQFECTACKHVLSVSPM